jgi:ectoine hydroxylase-related dioxygenase (phytanoyl-CoA dioxygenase family)
MSQLQDAPPLQSQHRDLSAFIRDLTDAEVEQFDEFGWVHVRGFVDPLLCEKIIAHYAAWTGMHWREWPEDPAEQQRFRETVDRFRTRPKWYFAIRQEDPWMFNYVTQRKFGEAASRLIKAPEIKPLSETLHVKYPEATERAHKIDWHQDFPSLPIDRALAVQFWLALVPITVDMGPMVHLNGSHRSPPGGMMGETGEDAKSIYPELFERYECSKPRDYAAGDAIFHHSLTWHASSPNLTNKVRWAMSSYRVAASCRYTGQANFNTDGLGLEPRKTFDHPNFPTVFP